MATCYTRLICVNFLSYMLTVDRLQRYLTPTNKFIGVFILDQCPQLGEESRDVRVVFHLSNSRTNTLRLIMRNVCSVL